jgi:anti-sigma factor RsiW
VVAELAGYLDDQVTAELRQELQRHLAQCHTCRVIYDSTRKTLQIVTESRSFELSEGVSARLMTNIMSRVRPGRRRHPHKGSRS